ncbi:MAG: hypothetical protein ACRD82_22060 [Blastocatellia bacterium]
MRFEIQDLRFEIQDLRFEIQDLRFEIQDLRFVGLRGLKDEIVIHMFIGFVIVGLGCFSGCLQSFSFGAIAG